MISRRTFLALSAGTAAAAVAAHYAIKWPKFSHKSAPKEGTHGVQTETFVYTSCLNCRARCAINVRVVNGKTVRILGNPNSTYTNGKTCPRSHIGLQVLYDPERIKTPLKRAGAKGRGEDPKWQAISWEAALDEISEKLATSSGQPNRLLVLQGLNTSSDEDLIRRFAQAYGTRNLFSEDDLETAADREGKRLADGRGNSGYELESTDYTYTHYILAFSASIVESEIPLSRNLRLWGKIRRKEPNRAKIVVIDPRYSVTAAKADEWIPNNPGTEGTLAMAIAYVMISEGLYDEEFVANWTYGFKDYKKTVLENFRPEDVASRTGVAADVIRRTAREFARSRPAIAWSGKGATSWPHGTYASHAIYCLNALVGSMDARGGIIYQEPAPYQDMPAISGAAPGIDFRETANLILQNAVDVVIGFNSNLIMSFPETKEGASIWEAPLKKVPYYVHIAPSLTEMADYADIVLPACTYLEEWGYETAPPASGYAEVRIKQPTVESLYGSRPTARVIFDLAARTNNATRDAFTNIGDSPEGFVRYRTGAFVDWDTFEANGVWEGPDYQYGKYDQVFHTDSKKFEFHSANLTELLNVKFVGNEGYPLKLVTYQPVLHIRNGSQNYPWAQEIFLVLHGYGWDNFVEMNTETAHGLGIDDLDRVWIQSDIDGTTRRIKARARVFEGMLPGVMAIAVGQGHYAPGKWDKDIGVNPYDIIGLDYDTVSGQPSFSNTRVKVYKA
jgi:thiosulfate reductase/polysulfide reductase chain A